MNTVDLVLFWRYYFSLRIANSSLIKPFIVLTNNTNIQTVLSQMNRPKWFAIAKFQSCQNVLFSSTLSN